MSAPHTSTDITIEHYSNPRIKAAILKFCEPREGCFRALNGDAGWYASAGNGNVRLRISDDYDDTTSKHRTLYSTLDVMDSKVKAITEKWDEAHNRPEHPIGTFAECLSYTLGGDIDAIGDIVGDPTVKLAVESMARYLCLELACIRPALFLLYSGGGIYILLHDSICQARAGKDPVKEFQRITIGFKDWLTDAEHRFFQLYPEFIGKVKVDKLTHQKRKFKTLFSVHKRLPFAVIPLDPDNICIDFENARIPLSDDTITEGEDWYKLDEIVDLEKFAEILEPYLKTAEAELKLRKERAGNYEVKHLYTALGTENWPPCMKNILRVEDEKGKHRALAVLAAYLYQVGWKKEDAIELWEPIARRCNVENRIFDVWYGQMSCPNCITIRGKSSGYPNVGLGDLGFCQKDDICRTARWPGGYGTKPVIHVTTDLPGDIDECLQALQDYNDPPLIFQRSGGLVRFQDMKKDGFRIQELTGDMLKPEMGKMASFLKWDKSTKMYSASCTPPTSLANGILAQMTWDVPQITGLVNAPVVRADGSLLLQPGYDAESGLFYCSANPLVMPPIPDRPTAADAAAAAKYLIEEILIDFPFDGMKGTANASRTNALAAVISPIVRPMVNGGMPMCLIDKPAPGTGASLLMDLISIIATGEKSANLSPPDNEEEWRKQITSWLRDGSPLISLDNIASDLKSPSLSRALTSNPWRDRVLGKPDDAKYPQVACWYANGNSLTLGGDLPRRSYLVQMDAKSPRPWERMTKEFHHEDILGWVTAHRAEILAKIMIMARAWVVAGRPAGKHTKVLGGFNAFTDVLGGILSYAGVEMFLDNMDRLYETLDSEGDEWEQFWEVWYSLYGSASKTATEILLELTKKEGSRLSDVAPIEISEKIQFSGPGSAMKIGKVLRKKVGVESKNGYKLVHPMTDTDKKTRSWVLLKKGVEIQATWGNW